MASAEHLALFDLLRTGMKLGVENNDAGEE
jgi:hypothetical protein